MITHMRAGVVGLMMAALGLAACAAPDTGDVARRRAVVSDALPPMKLFPATPAAAPTRGNADHAQDFLDLMFRMESGRELPILTRFEGPVTVRMIGPVPPSAAHDLDVLVARLRDEAGIDIRRVAADRPAALTVDFITRTTLQRQVPQAACFVVPNVTDWRSFRAARRSDRLDWAALTARTHATMFIPADTSPQEIRDCLNEELAQALGPLNDLYRLSDSVFNDDNFHTVLTGFDMLMLRVAYAPELQPGMTRDQVAARLPGILRRLNPAGEGKPAHPVKQTPRDWIDAIETALGPDASRATRRSAAERAVRIGLGEGWQDARMAFGWYVLGRLTLANEADTAFDALQRAAAIYRTLPGTSVHLAHIDMQMAAFALASGQPEHALDLINRSLIPVVKEQNAALLASMLMLKSAALETLNRPSEAAVVRLDSLGWARYGFGSEDEVRNRLAEIAILSPHITLAGTP